MPILLTKSFTPLARCLSIPIYRPMPRLCLRQSSSNAPRPEPHPAAKPSWENLYALGKPEANKPMFEQLALLTPAIIPNDPDGIIRPGDGVAKLLDNSALVVERRLEMLTVFLVIPCFFVLNSL